MPDEERQEPMVAPDMRDVPARPAASPRPARARKVGVGESLGLSLVTLVAYVLNVALYLYSGTQRTQHTWYWYAAAGMLTAAIILRVLYCVAGARFALVASDEGVTRWASRRRHRVTVPWEQIGGCRIYRDGHTMWCAILDREGNELLRANVTNADNRDCDRLVEMVREKRGTAAVRRELIAAEAPAGLGTELEASGAPVGRGTEPEAGPAPAAEHHGRPA